MRLIFCYPVSENSPRSGYGRPCNFMGIHIQHLLHPFCTSERKTLDKRSALSPATLFLYGGYEVSTTLRRLCETVVRSPSRLRIRPVFAELLATRVIVNGCLLKLTTW